MNIKLVQLEEKYQKQCVEMLEEWTKYNNTHPNANHSPWAIFQEDCHDFSKYLKAINSTEVKEGYVPSTTYFTYDEDRDVFVGAVNIRHYLNEILLRQGGHIGDGVRPGERGKGYGTKQIALALEKCKELGIDKVLIVCDKTNIGSMKTIVNNGGILENEIEVDGNIEQRYWINL